MTPATIPTLPPGGPPHLPASPAAPVPPALPPGPTPFRWTIAEYRELDKLDVFRDRKTFLLNGEIYLVPQANPPHDTALGLTQDWLRGAFAGTHHVRVQMGFDVGTRHDPGPDIAVVPGGIRDYAGRTPTTAALVVEVADSSLAIDTTEKAEKYATAGVPDYWVIDLVNRKLLVFRDAAPLAEGLGATAYRSHVTLNPDETVAPLLAQAAAVRVADLLP
jgi:Uma2 family endonuclease